MKRQMKDSGIEWIGQIPEEWHVSKIKNVYIVILGKMLSPSQTQKDQTLENYLCAANIKWSGVDTSIQKQMWFSESDKAEYKLHEGDILIMEGGLAGTSCKYRGEMAPCFIQNSVHCCRAKSNYSNQFLYYWMNVVYNSKYIENICNKATIQHYTKEKVMNTPFLICSSLEQEKIVSYLDRKCAQIDAIIAKQQQIIEKLKEYKLSVITEAVTKGLDPNVPMKDSGVEWIGMVPEEWRISRIKYICEFNPGTKKANHDVVSYAPMECVKDGYLIKKEIRHDGISTGLTSFEEGDIIMAKVTPCFENGNIAIAKDLVNKFGVGSSELFVFRAKKVNTQWLFYFLRNSIFKKLAEATMTGTGGLKRVSPSFIRDFSLALPPEKEQRRIIEYLDKKCMEIDRVIKYKQSAVEKLGQYKKSLIYEVVTGKMEV